MLFNSYIFIYLFLPSLLIVYYVFGRKFSITILALSSLIFYSYSEFDYLYLLLGSISFNFTMGRFLSNTQKSNKRKLLLSGAIITNILVLGYYKYFNFIIEIFNSLNFQIVSTKVILPLGISFFTFTQLAFLIDCYRQKANEKNFLDYLLFVTYFPHLIAGPILHHKQMISQFKNLTIGNLNYQNLFCGIIFFTIGMTKKILIADQLIPYVDYIFEPKNINNITFIDSYLGVLSYTFQLYFDFSGYCDMAIGISKMFNIDLPINFNSPYKSVTIIDFWRRWHITLSNFLKEYLYIPLGGNRKGQVRRYINLFITMLIGGIWHGAGFTFIV